MLDSGENFLGGLVLLLTLVEIGGQDARERGFWFVYLEVFLDVVVQLVISYFDLLRDDYLFAFGASSAVVHLGQIYVLFCLAP